MAKANILLALAPELKAKREFDVQLKVYMADTLQTAEKTNKNYLSVPDGMGREFTIPLKSLEMDRNLDEIIDQMAEFAQRGASSEVLLEQARSGFLAKIEHLTTEEINLAMAREKTRMLVDEQIRKLDSLVESLFGTAASPTLNVKEELNQASIF